MSLQARLAEQLSARAILSPAELARAQSAAEATGQRFDHVLGELGLIRQEQLNELLNSSLGVADATSAKIALRPIDLPLSADYLSHKAIVVLALDRQKRAVDLAMADPFDDYTAKAVGLRLGCPIVKRWRVSNAVLNELYGNAVDEVGASEALNAPGAESADIVKLRDAASDAPVIRFVQEMVRAAARQGASDIHLRLHEARAELLYRVDGELRTQSAPDRRIYPSIISRLKILAGLDIAERRLPQDGQLTMSVDGTMMDIRIATMAHVHGEAAVLRLLSRQATRSSLTDLGFSPGVMKGLLTVSGFEEGLFLVTGPTGSGKTTTLHALLRQLIRPGVNIVAIEDPVEYRVDEIAQIQIDEHAGVTFPKVLRSVLRQDPDIILVGEIRDSETASIAVQAALTGHLVLATLHTNSALAAVPRLVDMGVEPYLLASVLRGVLAQRLLRRRCTHGGSASGAHCNDCGGSGYAGRAAIGELAFLDEGTIESLARSPVLPPLLENRLRSTGYVPLKDDAAHRVALGDIDIEMASVA